MVSVSSGGAALVSAETGDVSVRSDMATADCRGNSARRAKGMSFCVNEVCQRHVVDMSLPACPFVLREHEPLLVMLWGLMGEMRGIAVLARK
jgi:hypothetical protein